MNFWITHYKSFTEILYFSFGLLYFYHALSNFISYRLNKRRAIVLNLAMCLFSAYYCFSFFIASYFKTDLFKEIFIPQVYLASVASIICYFYLIQTYFKENFKILSFITKFLMTLMLIMILDVFYFFKTDNFFLFENIQGVYTSYYGEVVNLPKKLTLYGRILFLLTALSLLPASTYLFFWIKKNRPHEKLLLTGLVLTIIATLHDLLFGTGKLYYSMTLIYTSAALEAIRFTYHYQKESFLKTIELKNELNKIAKAAHIGQLIGSIFHDIRNPLSILSLQNERLLKYKNSGETQEKIIKGHGVMKKNITRINEIISSYMGIIHHDSQGSPSTQNLFNIVNEAIKLSAPKIKQTHVQVLNNISKTDTLLCFSSDMILVITNLITNSCDSIDEAKSRKPWIDIRFQKGCLHVIDSGPGVSADIVDQIFNMQFTTKAEGKGTGLGLGIIKEVLSRMKYDIYIDQSAKNTTFVIKPEVT